MQLDFGKLAGVSPVDTETNPRNIFSLLPTKENDYQYLRDVQAEVLNAWHERRDEKDLILKMNTGGGKTVVGLLILKSCLNEQKGPAVYVTPDPYLVQQVVKEAGKLGIEVTEDPKSSRFLRGKAILVINIFRLINGLSVFGVGQQASKIEIGALVVDDVHACLSITESQFTVSIGSEEAIYKELWDVFKDGLQRQYPTQHLLLADKIPGNEVLVPYWMWRDKLDTVSQIFHSHRDSEILKFNYPLIRENLEFCQCAVGGGMFEISPIHIPIAAIPSFYNAKRRVFMSATLSDDTVLVSHFDASPEAIAKTITPSTANDIGDRMILLPFDIWPELEIETFRKFIKQVSKDYNSVVIVPSHKRAEAWSEIADLIIASKDLEAGTQKLRDGHVGLAVIINKYDGIDLPNDACRILVLDGLPDARRKIDRIRQATLHGSSDARRLPIQKIEQGMGRGIRANNDHCVVFLVGSSLTEQVCAHSAFDLFSPATRAQMGVSDRLADQLRAGEFGGLRTTISYCLNKNPEWVGVSRGALLHVKYQQDSALNSRALAQRRAFNQAQVGGILDAVSTMRDLVNVTDDKLVRGSLKQEMAFYQNFLDPAKAQESQKSAKSDNHWVLAPLAGIEYSKLHTPAFDQARLVTEWVSTNYQNMNRMLVEINAILDALVFQPETAGEFEFALQSIARFLGLRAQRPEAEYSKGPDVLWEIGSLNYLVIEAKNGATTSTISKRDGNQLAGSTIWFSREYDSTCRCVPIIVHPAEIFEKQANPPEETRVINRSKLSGLKDNVLGFVKAIASEKAYSNPVEVERLLREFKLAGSMLVDTYTVQFRMER